MYLYISIDNLFAVKGKHRISKKKTNYKKHQDTGRRRVKLIKRNNSQITKPVRGGRHTAEKHKKEGKRSTKKARQKKMEEEVSCPNRYSRIRMIQRVTCSSKIEIQSHPHIDIPRIEISSTTEPIFQSGPRSVRGSESKEGGRL